MSLKIMEQTLDAQRLDIKYHLKMTSILIFDRFSGPLIYLTKFTGLVCVFERPTTIP